MLLTHSFNCVSLRNRNGARCCPYGPFEAGRQHFCESRQTFCASCSPRHRWRCSAATERCIIQTVPVNQVFCLSHHTLAPVRFNAPFKLRIKMRFVVFIILNLPSKLLILLWCVYEPHKMSDWDLRINILLLLVCFVSVDLSLVSGQKRIPKKM